MKASPRRRKGESNGLVKWTERLNRFADAKTAEERQAVLETALQINPGGTIRSMLEAWGYSASSRGRKAKGTETGKDTKPARERLEAALKDVFGGERSPVRSLYPKLAGSAEVSVRDAGRIIAALIASWPEPLTATAEANTAEQRKIRSKMLAEHFIRELLAELSSARSRQWSPEEMEVRVFKMVDEQRVGSRHFIKDATQEEGALIVAGSKTILVGTGPEDVINQFINLTEQFISEGRKGILIFVVNAAIFEAGEDKFKLIYNLGLLATAITAFAVLQHETPEASIQAPKIDWGVWRTLDARCCIVMRRPPLVNPETGEFLARGDFDEFISEWKPPRHFDVLKEFTGIVSFDSQHVLPQTYPPGFAEGDGGANDLYWDVRVRPSRSHVEGLEVEYFMPPPQRGTGLTHAVEPSVNGAQETPPGTATRGRPSNTSVPIEEDAFYVIRKESPGQQFDNAQRAIYRAARARLGLDTGLRQTENIFAASALRAIGFEVLPISVAITLLPRSLYFAAASPQAKIKRNTSQ